MIVPHSVILKMPVIMLVMPQSGSMNLEPDTGKQDKTE